MSGTRLPALPRLGRGLSPAEREARLQARHEVMAKAVEAIQDGRTLREIAAELEIDMMVVHQWLLSNVPQEYRAAQEAGLIARITDADQEIDDADGFLNLQKADRKAKYARWDAERRLKHLFSPSQELTGADRTPLMPQDPAETARRLAFLMARGGIPITVEGESSVVEEGAAEAPGGATREGEAAPQPGFGPEQRATSGGPPPAGKASASPGAPAASFSDLTGDPGDDSDGEDSLMRFDADSPLEDEDDLSDLA